MTLKSLRAPLIALAALASSTSFAQDASSDSTGLIEKVVVRNRLYNMSGRFELTPSVGLTLVTRLTDHYNFNLGFAWNVSDTLAFEVRGGYALSRHTGLANQVSEHVMQRNPNPPRSDLVLVSDLSGLWEMNANGIVGVRWAPLYGKISLMAELPVHFQAYLSAGAGAGTFHRESIVYCTTVPDRATGTCDSLKTDDRVGALGTGALGFRFFTHQGGGIKVEIRDYIYQDDFLVDINRVDAESGRETGTPSTNPGLINLVMVDLGYSFIF